MFIEKQTQEQKENYTQLLKSIGSLSKLFSEAKEPYLQYRVVENLFCRSFESKNMSRSDVAVDASKQNIGIGIKTYLKKGEGSFEKIAEFNKDHSALSVLQDNKDLIQKIAELRNARIDATKRIHGLDSTLYHCVVRTIGEMLVCESPMSLIDVDSISNIHTRNSENIVRFSDAHNDYFFSKSKNTLYKRFITQNPILTVPVQIIEDPFTVIEALLADEHIQFTQQSKEQSYVFLPLYSTKQNEAYVPEKSGLNFWNAGGRPRDFLESYIPIPAWIHKQFPNFFPARDESFDLILPNDTTMSAKVCQQDEKALMSNPNSALGQWLLRDVLNLQQGELATYDMLQKIGLDSVVIYKIYPNKYDINFTSIGSYQRFKQRFA